MKTFQDILVFFNAAGPWLEKHKADSKFAYAVKKVHKQCKARWDSYSEQVEDIDIEHCAVDEKTGVILKDERAGLQFTKEGIKKRNAARRALFLSDAGVTPFLGKNPPADLTDAERDAFAGFVLPELDEDEEPAAVEQLKAKPRRIDQEKAG